MKAFLTGQICVVTGGTQGIGWAIGQALADYGGTVYACGYSQTSLENAQSRLSGLPWADRIHLSRCDVSNQDQFEEWLHTIYAQEGQLDVLVNNAAFVRWADTVDMSVEEQLYTMAVGFNGPLFGMKTVLPWMLENNRGHIVNIGSIAGRIFVGGQSAAYGAVKAAIDAYTQALCVELEDTAVNATIMRLGTVAGTDFLQKHVSNERMPPFTKFLPSLTPPQVAEAVIQAIAKKKQIVTLPRFLTLLAWTYHIAPRFSRWLAYKGGANTKDYGRVPWHYQPHKHK